jgi:hypothetical protein
MKVDIKYFNKFHFISTTDGTEGADFKFLEVCFYPH